MGGKVAKPTLPFSAGKCQGYRQVVTIDDSDKSTRGVKLALEFLEERPALTNLEE